MSITETTKLQFSRIRNSMIFNLKNTKVAVEVHAYQGRLHTKFEENRVKGFQDMSEQISSFFLCLFSPVDLGLNPEKIRTKTNLVSLERKFFTE